MTKKSYTVLIVSQKASKVKKLMFSPLALKLGLGVLVVFLAIVGFIIYDYAVYKRKVTELEGLRAKTQSQQAEIHSFMEKITILEDQLNRLKEMEKQMESDLKEVNDLKKTKRSNPAIAPQRTPALVQEGVNKGKEKSPLPTQEVTIRETSRPPLVTFLCGDLFDLSKTAHNLKQNLTQLREFLLAKKSVLEATPSLWPVFGRISSRFGDTRLSPSSGGTRPHLGVDISVPKGTPVFAPADGVIRFAGQEPEYGRLICLEHGHGYSTVFGHLNTIQVQTGDRVVKGQLLGTAGNTGYSTGPHLHYEVRIHGNPVNPTRYLTETK